MRTNLLFFLLCFCSCFAGDKPVHQGEIMSHVLHHLKNTGTIVQDLTGAVYVTVDPGYTSDLLRWIEEEGFENPEDAYGPHILLMSGNEVKGHIDEVGLTVTFTINDCVIVPSDKENIEATCVLQVSSPPLLNLRAKYRLHNPATPLHIAIGKKPRIKNLPLQRQSVISRN